MRTDFVSNLEMQNIQSESLIELLAKYDLLNKFIKSSILEKEISSLNLSSDESSRAKEEYARQYSLNSDKDYLNHINENNLNKHSLNYKIELPLKVIKFAKNLFKNRIHSEFLKRKKYFDVVIYSIINQDSENKAIELYLRITEEKSSFSELSAKYSLGPEKDTFGICGPVNMSNVNSVLQEKIISLKEKELSKPFRIKNNWYLLRLEKYYGSSLNMEVEKQILYMLLDEYLEKKIPSLEINQILNKI